MFLLRDPANLDHRLTQPVHLQTCQLLHVEEQQQSMLFPFPPCRYAGGLLRSSTSRDSSHLQQQLQRKGTGVVSVRTPIHVWPDSRLVRLWSVANLWAVPAACCAVDLRAAM